MADLGSITALITAAGSVIGLANKSSSVEANQKILELQQRLAEVQQTFAELFEENQRLKERGRELEAQINEEISYPFMEGVRWKKSADGGKNDGPFCPVCFGKDRKLMPLRFRGKMTTPELLSFTCPQMHPAQVGAVRDMIFVIRESLIKEGRYSFTE
ncbi:MAG TPA: hypothetical protein VG028_03530 [Terriglobia bacterium]|nr:hypothetical protein [Terriglobia bacterium]